MKYLIITLVILLSFAVSANADLDLIGQGTSTHGTYNLIYDTDLDITWYDYTSSRTTWQTQVAWAGALSVTFGSNIYTDWRLPSTVDGLRVWGHDGTTTAGVNITSSEMGHLFYAELGNTGYIDSYGNYAGCSPNNGINCLTKTGDFQNLIGEDYWSDTQYTAGIDDAWGFGFGFGHQDIGNGELSDLPNSSYGLAVMSGRAIVPEPTAMILFLSGGATMLGRYWRKKK